MPHMPEPDRECVVRDAYRLVDSAVGGGGGGQDGIHRAAAARPAAEYRHRVDDAHELRSQ